MSEIGTSGSKSGDGKRAIGTASHTAPILGLYLTLALRRLIEKNDFICVRIDA